MRSSATPARWSRRTAARCSARSRHPLNTDDFSSFLLQAQASKAKVIGLANAGGDTINSIKQAAEFGIVKGGQKLAGLLVFASDVNALGLQTAQGLSLTETWYWDANDANRAWTKRWQAERDGAGKFPTMIHAGVYAGILHYLKARGRAEAAPTDGKTVVAKMKEMPTDDPLFGKGTIRADGRKIHDGRDDLAAAGPSSHEMGFDQAGGDAQIRFDEAAVELDRRSARRGEAEIDMIGVVARIMVLNSDPLHDPRIADQFSKLFAKVRPMQAGGDQNDDAVERNA